MHINWIVYCSGVITASTSTFATFLQLFHFCDVPSCCNLLFFKAFHTYKSQLGKWNKLHFDFQASLRSCLCVLLTFQFSGAKEWIDQCFIVPDFAEPLVVPAFGGATSSGAAGLGAVGLDNQPPEEMVAIIISMGFQRNLAIQALKATVSSLS